MARPRPRRRRRRGLGALRGDAVERAADGGPRDPVRRPPGARPARRGGRRAGAHGRGAPATRRFREAADDRPLSQRPSGGRPARLPPDQSAPRRRTRPRPDAGARRAAGEDPQPRSRTGGAGQPVDASGERRRGGRRRPSSAAQSPDLRRCPSRRRSSGRGRGRSSAATASSPSCTGSGRTSRRAAHTSPCCRARPGPASRASAPASPRRPTRSVPSSCGVERRPRCSCRSSRWSRQSARCCAPSPPRLDGGWRRSADCSPCSCPSSSSWCPRRASSGPTRASSATCSSRRWPSSCGPNQRSTRSCWCSTTCSGPTSRPCR